MPEAHSRIREGFHGAVLYLSTLYLAEHRLHDDYDGMVHHLCLKPITRLI